MIAQLQMEFRTHNWEQEVNTAQKKTYVTLTIAICNKLGGRSIIKQKPAILIRKINISESS